MRETHGGQLRFLSPDDVARIQRATIEVLDEVGVRVCHRPALAVMEAGGCRVDFTTGIVRTPEHVLRRCLSTAPSRFTLYARDPDRDVRVDQSTVWTIGGSSALYTLGLDGVRHLATLNDLAELTRLQDSLENLHIMHGIVNPQDIPQDGFDRILFATVMKNTARNYYSQAIGTQGVRDQVEMASFLAGGGEEFRRRPFFTIVVCMVSPFVHPGIRVEELMECAAQCVPVYVEADSMPGATTPVTLAGTLVEQTANVLTGVCLAQMIRPGLPCVYAIASGAMDLASGNYSAGAPETQILHAATVQIAHAFGLPCQAGTGVDSTLPDAQSGYERGLQFLTCSLAGADFVHLATGMLEQMLTASFEQCVVDDEILGAALRITRGLEVNDETLALGLIKEVGVGGDYVAEEHTVRNMRDVTWRPGITNRQKWDAWEDGGGLDMRQRAARRAQLILSRPAPSYMDPKMAAELDRMAAAFQAQAVAAARESA